MSSRAKTVLWLGVFMIVFNVAVHWSEIAPVLFGSAQTVNTQNPAPNGTAPSGTTPTPHKARAPVTDV